MATYLQDKRTKPVYILAPGQKTFRKRDVPCDIFNFGKLLYNSAARKQNILLPNVEMIWVYLNSELHENFTYILQ